MSLITPTKPMEWKDLPNGEWIQEAVEDKLDPWWPKIFGYHMLSVGPLSATLEKGCLPIGRQFSLGPCSDQSVIGDFSELPIQNGVIDAVVCSLILDFEHDPYKVLRETDRVLIAGGYLFIIGFNPLSPAFVGKLLPQFQQKLPWSGRFFRPSRVKDWLGLLGYQIVADERLGYHHFLTEIQSDSIWQHALQAWLPGSGSLYLLVARKLATPLTPIRERKRVRQPKWSTAPSAGRAEHLHKNNQ